MATRTKKIASTTCTTTKGPEQEKYVLTADVVALQKNKVIIAPDCGTDNRIPVSTVQAHLMQYRYMLSREAFEELSKCDLSVIEMFHNQAITYLKTMMGGKTSPKPLYKNFPQEVMSKTDGELYWNAMGYYWTNGKWAPESVELEKPVEFENVKYTTIQPVDDEGFKKIFTDLVSINTSLTPMDLNVVKWFASTYKEILKEMLPDKIPFKENLMTLAAMGIPVPVKTPTDVLRIAVHMSGGDISLPAVPPKIIKTNKRFGYGGRVAAPNPDREKFKFRHFKRPERRYILELLEQTHCDPREMILKDQRWVRLGEVLHPGEYKDKFPKSFRAFDSIRNSKGKKKVRSWYSKVVQLLETNLNLEAGLKVLSERPGEFVRKLDWLVRTYDNSYNLELIGSHLEKVLEGSSNKVLFEIYTHLEGRREATKGRSVFIKGARKKTPLPELAALKPNIVDDLQSSIFVALRSKFGKLGKLGNVWVDPELKKIPVPTNMRSLNLSLKPTVRGTRTPFDNPDAKVIRAFVHWDGGRGGTDLDLSASFVGDKKAGTGMTSYDSYLSYSNLKVGKSCHSGDVINRPGPCAEYIDIDLKDAAKMYKYVLISLRNFKGGSLSDFSAVFGYMERKHPESNKTWLPETIVGAQQLEASGTGTYIAIVDLETKEYIHLDIDSDSRVEAGQGKDVLGLIEDYAKPPKFSVYDLLLMHTEARGRLVGLDQNVDTYFKYEDFCHSYEQTGKYML